MLGHNGSYNCIIKFQVLLKSCYLPRSIGAQFNNDYIKWIFASNLLGIVHEYLDPGERINQPRHRMAKKYKWNTDYVVIVTLLISNSHCFAKRLCNRQLGTCLTNASNATDDLKMMLFAHEARLPAQDTYDNSFQ